MGCTVKLLAICERVKSPDGAKAQVAVARSSAMIPRTHPLLGVGGRFQRRVRGGGGRRIAHVLRSRCGAVPRPPVQWLGDLVAVARNRVSSSRGAGQSAYAELPIQPIGDVATRYHVALDVADQAGRARRCCRGVRRTGVSIQTVRQEGRGNAATLVLVTHSASDAALAKTVDHVSDMHSSVAPA